MKPIMPTAGTFVEPSSHLRPPAFHPGRASFSTRQMARTVNNGVLGRAGVIDRRVPCAG